MQRPSEILIVDDEPDIRDIIGASFPTAELCFAESGNTAIKLFDKNPHYDLVTTDLNMADGDGLSLIRHIRKTSLNLPILLITTDFADITPELEQLGLIECIGKPWRHHTLAERAESVLRQALDRQNELQKSLQINATVMKGVETAVDELHAETERLRNLLKKIRNDRVG